MEWLCTLLSDGQIIIVEQPKKDGVPRLLFARNVGIATILLLITILITAMVATLAHMILLDRLHLVMILAIHPLRILEAPMLLNLLGIIHQGMIDTHPESQDLMR